MGFINSGTTSNIEASLTQKGREYFFKNKNNFQIFYFALGDSDANYLIQNQLGQGFVPDITGNNENCINPIAQNIEIKYKIIK